MPCAITSSTKYSPWMRFPIRRPCMSVNAVTTVSIVPASISFRSSSTVSIPRTVLDAIDALRLAGGGDVHPSSYGPDREPETPGTTLVRDEFEIALARGALERDMPVLGICRGMQLLNVALGGTLVQHLPQAVGHGHHPTRPGIFDHHEVELDPGSLAPRAAGPAREPVKSHHHQGAARPGPRVGATGLARA